MTLDLVAFYRRAWKPHSGRGRQPFRTRSPSQNPSAQTALHAKYNLTFPRRKNWPQKFSTWGEVGGFQVSAQAAPRSGRKTLTFSVRLAPGWRVSSRGQVCWGSCDQDSQRLWLPQAAPAPCGPAPGPGPGPGCVWEGARWQFWERPAGGLGFCLAVCAEDFFFFLSPWGKQILGVVLPIYVPSFCGIFRPRLVAGPQKRPLLCFPRVEGRPG